MGRRLVIPDIHGCVKTFKALVDMVSLSKNDSLYLLGDYIDRGPSSSGVIDFILKLQSEGYNVVPIRGNHEHEILDAFNEYDTPTFKFYVRRFKSIDLLDSDYRIKEPYLSFMSNLPFYIELPDCYLVHGGIDFSKDNPFDNLHQILVLRRTTYDAEKAKNKRIVVGHQPTHLSVIEKAIECRALIIPLDNGCIYTKPHKIYDYKQMGNLLCLDLDNFELIKMKNIDSPL